MQQSHDLLAHNVYLRKSVPLLFHTVEDAVRGEILLLCISVKLQK